MLSIILTILKIAGCIILALLLLIILAILLILFVPLRYRAAGARYEDITADADVTWLLKLLHVICSFDNKREEEKLRLQVKVLGFTIYSNIKNEKDTEKEKPVTEEIPEQEDVFEEKPAEKEEAGTISEEPEAPAEPEPTNPEPEEETVFSEEEISSEIPEQPKESIKEKLKRKFQRKQTQPSFAEKMERKMEELQRKAEKIRVKKDHVMQIIDDEKNQRWLKKVLTRLKKLILYLVPQIDKLYLHFGFKDPSSTGKTLGLLSMLYPVCEDRMQLEPEFETQVLEGEAAIKGRIRLIRFAAFVVPSFVNPRFIKLIKQVKRI